MQYRRLGRTGMQVSEIGFGAWGIGGDAWGSPRDAEAIKALERALDAGLNFIDTALAYGEGHSERLVGEVVRRSGRRVGEDVFVATKVPPKDRVWPARAGSRLEDVFPYEHVVGCAERSLEHLGLPHIDLLQLHVWNDEWAGLEDWRRAFRDLRERGVVRHFGISINDHQPDNALAALETGLVDVVQVIYNIFDQTPEARLFPKCRELDVGVIARVPLDEGGLTGAIGPDTRFEPGDWREHYFRGERRREVAERVDALGFLLHDGVNSIAEAALRFCLSNPAVSTVIPGMRSPARVDANARVSDGRGLPTEDLERLKAHAWPRNFYE
jgi:aryl-alcohol dehydrogenase-like predicted oxidoreductase